MKIRMFLTFWAAFLLAGVTIPVRAQHARPVTLRGTIPFAFVYGNRVLPGGTYSIEIAELGVRLLDANGHPLETIIPGPRERSAARGEQPTLVFHRYGNSCFLAQIWTADLTLNFRVSRSERTLNARVHTPPEHLNIAMR